MRKKQVVKHFGGITKAAQALNISRQAVSKWPDIVPIKQAWKIERLTGGKVAFRINDYRMKALK